MVKAWTARRRRHKAGSPGQGLVEYGLIILMVAMVVVVIMLTMGQQVGGLFSSIGGGGVGVAAADCKPAPPGKGKGKGLLEAIERAQANWCPE
ncbi:MAG: hypothetical protein AAB289_00420 [Chloroflexota bacterium]